MKNRGLILEQQVLDLQRTRSGGANRRRPKRFLLGWTVTMTLLITAATFSWIFCLYVFGHPERPFSYDVLSKLQRIEPPKRFDHLTVPDGSAYKPKEIFARYLRYPQAGEEHLLELNAELHRNFVTNYSKADSIDYVRGKFRVFDIQPLDESHIFPSGVAICAQAVDCPDLTIEYLFPGEAIPQDFFRPGDVLSIEGTTAFATVLNCAQIAESKLCLTLVPLVYGSYVGPNGSTVALSPPDKINLKTSWPVAGGHLPPSQIAGDQSKRDAPGAVAGLR
ncbi:hypothetical protein [Sulfuriroseicoccus oceanibius]|uniref:Uncharacterized protein n=1 Tax=Sulfuriroseicoccus oceanibius TaxID=2707525 RepID=A0A6B3LF84_9BACT|nr:hypothetical protein [Sulfuriroseicoccus oceanibius]QQL44989.1 hypothetical protein G3M56_014180 [Sulfuriroseicoccus oceanibius]